MVVWGGAGSNKKKGTGCHEPSMEGAAQSVLSQAPRAEAASLFPNLSFSETEWLHLHLDAAEFADTVGTTGVSERKKVVGGGGGWKQPQANRVLS